MIAPKTHRPAESRFTQRLDRIFMHKSEKAGGGQTDHVALVDPRSRAIQALYGLTLPNDRDLAAIAPGDGATLILDYTVNDKRGFIEHAWINVIGVTECGRLIGESDDIPLSRTPILAGELIEFARHHVTEIHRADRDPAPKPVAVDF